MSWLRTGTVTVTNNSPAVTFVGVDLIANLVQPGDRFEGPDNNGYELGAITSSTTATLIPAYRGATAGGQVYAIEQTASIDRKLALDVGTILNTFSSVRDGVGQGLIPDGTVATPAIRFSADQDTGIRRTGPNAFALVSGGVDRLTVSPGPTSFSNGFYATGSAPLPAEGPAGLVSLESPVVRTYIGDGTGYSLAWSKRAASVTTDLVTITDAGNFSVGTSGNLLVGVMSGTYHRIVKDVVQGGIILEVSKFGTAGCAFYSSSGDYGSAAACSLLISSNSTTGRSINASGTINASGADYAEYMEKAPGCGDIAKGDVCGVDVDGKLTRKWADAISFVVKSTDPAYVGGDSWAGHMEPKPEAPGAEPTAPAEPSGDDATDEASSAYADALATYEAAHTAWQDATDAYAADLPVWEAELEAARGTVDRIAFSGQVPVNVDGSFEVGDYLIAVANGSGIKAVAIAASAITFEQYRMRVGKVWADRDGRPWVDVQHG